MSLLLLFDTVRFTHRIVGPLYRFQKALQAITTGDELPLVSIRKDDFLQEMKDELNGMIAALEKRGAVVVKKGPTPKVTQDALLV